MTDIFMYVVGMIITFIVGWASHAVYMSNRRDGTLTVRKTSDDELTTLFELTAKPESLLKNDYFVLRIERQ